MGFGLIYAESFDRNQDMAAFWLRGRQFLDHQTFKPTKTTQNNCTPPDASWSFHCTIPTHGPRVYSPRLAGRHARESLRSRSLSELRQASKLPKCGIVKPRGK